jgi:hypothetical protein
MSRGADYSRVRLIPPPTAGFWRVTDWDEPFDPRPAPPPLDETADAESDAGRWDAPDGSFRTLYCCTDSEGAIGEKIAPFVPNPAAVLRIEAFFESEPDPEWADDHLVAPLHAEDIDNFEWTLAHVDAEEPSEFIDVWHWKTCLVVAPMVAATLMSHGLRSLDRRALADERRSFTRRLAGALRTIADTGRPAGGAPHGLRYESRLPPGWECWALWEPLPIRGDTIDAVHVDIETPQLRSAAAKLGVHLAD